MDLELAGQVATGLLGLVSALIPFLGARASRKTLRDDLRQDVELLKELPPDSPSASKLAGHIERMIDILITDLERRRDPFGIGLGLSLIVLCTAGAIWAINEGGHWLWLLIPLAAVTAAASGGLAQDITQATRDEKGNPVKGSRTVADAPTK